MSEFFQNTAVIWFLVGLVLILVELVLPGLVLLFFGVGAWVTALVCLVSNPGINTQLFIFLAGSLISLVLLRNLIKKKYMDRKSPDSELEDEYIGQTAVAISSFAAGETGKVTFKGSNWEAIAQQAVTTGQRLRITGYKSIKLFVEPIQ
ncbi:MAG: NfeD family protein [Chitinophagaceae bacterium]|nr:NfeD family protein [Chitinophagaceae bacterium]MCB9045114.1 NfeD family protein [Chitinophagales bacterium]